MNKDLLIIRKVKREDARNWYTLNIKVWRDAYCEIFPEEVFIDRENQLDENIKSFDNKIQNNDKTIAYVAEYEGKIIGMMYGSINSIYEYFKSQYADLIALYVDPIFQGCGIGTLLKKEFEKWAKEHGASKYIIGVLKDNLKARKVYESWGGNLIDHEENFFRLGIGYPEVFYEYDLYNK